MSDPTIETGASPRVTELKHVVITVHGIRTYGGWQQKFGKLLKSRDIESKVFRYLYFDSISFLIPFVRWLLAWRFRKWIVTELNTLPKDCRVDIVAHSFGTYLVAKALPAIPQGRMIDTIIFAGSVLKPSFPWHKYVKRGTHGCVRRVINECGIYDSILVLNQLVALGMGMAGRVGFDGILDEQFYNRYHKFSHSGYFENDDFLKNQWLPILADDSPVEDIDCRPQLGPIGGAWMTVLKNFEIVKLAGLVVLIGVFIYIPMDRMYQKEANRQHLMLSRLSSLGSAAQQIPGRNPGHVLDILRKGLPKGFTLEFLSAVKSVNAAPVGGGIDEVEENADQGLLSWLFKQEDSLLKAMRAHAHANQILADSDVVVNPKTKVRDLLEEARKLYDRVDPKERPVGPYALCLLDYARLLVEFGDRATAIELYARLRKVFGDDAPPSLLVDSLCFEADALVLERRYAEAESRLTEAEAKATGIPELLAHIRNRQGWLDMERWNVEEARRKFQHSKELCDQVLRENRDNFVVQVMLFHVTHGEAMTERFLSDRSGSARREGPGKHRKLYDALIGNIRQVLDQNDSLLPKQRQDLRARLQNSLERRGDCDLFEALSPPPERVEHVGNAERYYDQAVGLFAGATPETKARLLYKKSIAHMIANRPGPIQVPNGRPGPTAESALASSLIDLTRENATRPSRDFDDGGMSGGSDAFAEAERTYGTLAPKLQKELDVYRFVATCCRKLQGEPDDQRLAAKLTSGASSRDPNRSVSEKDRGISDDLLSSLRARQKSTSEQALTDLRQGIKRHLNRTGVELKREPIEMLLLACEILLDERVRESAGIGQDLEYVKDDAGRLLEVAALATRGSAHPELIDYINRFNMKAARVLSPPLAVKPTEAPAAERRADSPPPEPAAPVASSEMLFYLKLSPNLELSVRRDARSPRIEMKAKSETTPARR